MVNLLRFCPGTYSQILYGMARLSIKEGFARSLIFFRSWFSHTWSSFRLYQSDRIIPWVYPQAVAVLSPQALILPMYLSYITFVYDAGIKLIYWTRLKNGTSVKNGAAYNFLDLWVKISSLTHLWRKPKPRFRELNSCCKNFSEGGESMP